MFDFITDHADKDDADKLKVVSKIK